MFFKLIPTSTVVKEIPKAVTPGFKKMNWSLTKQSSPEKKLSPSAQTIVNEMDNNSSYDVPAPILKK